MEEMVCTGCSLLCDDVAASEEGGVVSSLGFCRLGHVHLESAAEHAEASGVVREGKKLNTVSVNDAITKAADMLVSGERVLLYGWSHSTDETVEEGLDLATTLGGFFDSNASMAMAQSLSHEIHSMKLGIDLEYVRNNGEFVIYWGSDPTESSHRHPSRFAVLPRGEKIPEGIESRTIGVVDIRETETMKMANHRIIIPSGSDAELLNAISAEVSGDSSITGPVAGVAPTELLGLVRGLQKSDCTVIFYGTGIMNSKHFGSNLDSLSGLVKALRRSGKEAYALPMSHDSNIMGAIKTSNDATGSPATFDYASGSPGASSNSTALQKLVAGEFDSSLVVGCDSLAEMPGPAARALASTNLVYVGRPGGLTERKAAVSIFTTEDILTGAGTMHRSDFVEVGMKSLGTRIKGPLTQLEALKKIHEKVRQGSKE